MITDTQAGSPHNVNKVVGGTTTGARWQYRVEFGPGDVRTPAIGARTPGGLGQYELTRDLPTTGLKRWIPASGTTGAQQAKRGKWVDYDWDAGANMGSYKPGPGRTIYEDPGSGMQLEVLDDWLN